MVSGVTESVVIPWTLSLSPTSIVSVSSLSSSPQDCGFANSRPRGCQLDYGGRIKGKDIIQWIHISKGSYNYIEMLE